MLNNNLNNQNSISTRRGVVLIVAMVVLVVLSIIGYIITSKVAAQRSRNRYLIDYQIARYGRDSALKYALATLEDINSPVLIGRPNEPDFSDLFILSETEYQELLEEWADKSYENQIQSDANMGLDDNSDNDFDNFLDINSLDINSSDINFLQDKITDFNTTADLIVRGPYGELWPLVTKPAQLNIGSAKVKIEIHDENAKYPIGWAMLDDKKIRREALAGLETFCEWMDVNTIAVDLLEEELEKLNEIKKFELDFNDIKITKKEKVKTQVAARSRRGRRTRPARSRTKTKTTTVTMPATVHYTDFAKLLHSSLIDTQALAKPTIVSDTREESALKYIGMWGSSKVNINTAPRHVLEAAFVFGGDAANIADEIIQRRRIKPFDDLKELKNVLFKYSDSIDKCEKYIVTKSNFFTIRVTATSGVAKASAVVVVRKNKKNNKMEKIAVLSG